MATLNGADNPFCIDESDGDETTEDLRFNPLSSKQRIASVSTQILPPNPTTWANPADEGAARDLVAEETTVATNMFRARQLTTTKDEVSRLSKFDIQLTASHPDSFDVRPHMSSGRDLPGFARDHTKTASSPANGSSALFRKACLERRRERYPPTNISSDAEPENMAAFQTNTLAQPATFTQESDSGSNTGFSARRQPNLPKSTKNILLAWLNDRVNQRQPEENDVEHLVIRAGVSAEQICDWVANAAPGHVEALRAALARHRELASAKRTIRDSVIGSFLVRWLKVRNAVLAQNRHVARIHFNGHHGEPVAQSTAHSTENMFIGSQFLDTQMFSSDITQEQTNPVTLLQGIPVRTRGAGSSPTNKPPSAPLTTDSRPSRTMEHKQAGPLKRVSDRKDHEESDDEPDRPAPKKSQPQSQSIPLLLACPYWKLDCERYSERNASEKHYRHCASCYLPSISRLKQHLYRVHRAPQHHCFRCFEVFEDLSALQKHHQAMIGCPCRVSPFAEKFSDHEYRLLQKRWKGKSSTQSWFVIWQILFPKQMPPSSPFLELRGSSQLRVPDISKASYVADFKTRAPGLFRQILDEKHTNDSLSLSTTLRDRETMHSLLTSCLTELLQELDDQSANTQEARAAPVDQSALNQLFLEKNPFEFINAWEDVWHGLEPSSSPIDTVDANETPVDALPELPVDDPMADCNLDWLGNPFIDDFFNINDFISDHSPVSAHTGDPMVCSLTTENLDALVAAQPKPILQTSRSSMVLTIQNKVLADCNGYEDGQAPNSHPTPANAVAVPLSNSQGKTQPHSSGLPNHHNAYATALDGRQSHRPRAGKARVVRDPPWLWDKRVSGLGGRNVKKAGMEEKENVTTNFQSRISQTSSEDEENMLDLRISNIFEDAPILSAPAGSTPAALTKAPNKDE